MLAFIVVWSRHSNCEEEWFGICFLQVDRAAVAPSIQVYSGISGHPAHIVSVDMLHSLAHLSAVQPSIVLTAVEETELETRLGACRPAGEEEKDAKKRG